MTSKTIVLGEMIVLFGGSLVYNKQANASAGWLPAIVSKPVLRKAIAVTALLAILTFLCDIGLGTLAASFGALIVTGYLMAAGLGIGKAILDLETSVFGTSGRGSANAQ